MRSLQRLGLGFICLLGATSVTAGDMLDSVNHVCVILDTSYSMQGYTDKKTGQYHPPNDPGRLAVLSTVLLHDLLKPETGKGQHLDDTFAVLPFQSNYQKWTSGGAPTSTSVQPQRLTHIGLSPQQKTQARAQLIAKLRESSMPRTASWTYYAPYIEKALDCIPAPHAQDREATTRTIILITDGNSDNPDPDKAHIINVLLNKLRQHKTRLYVIFFETDPSELAKGEQFFENIYKADENSSYRVFPERAFAVSQGQELPAAMVRLFSRAFGYVHEPMDDQKVDIGPLPAPFDLAKSYKPERAVVVALRLDPSGNPPVAPTQDILASGGEAVDDDDPLTATEPGGSFSVVWVNQPRPVSHTVSITNGQAASVFVLRPTRLLVEMRDFLPLANPPQKRSCFDAEAIKHALSKKQEHFETMANTNCWIDLLVKSPSGDVTVLPDKLKVTFRVKEDLGGGAFRGIGKVDGEAIPDGNNRADPDAKGQRFYYWTNFEDKRLAGSPPRKFDAHVTVSIFREDGPVGGRGDDEPFRVDVYPKIEVEPSPSYRVIPDGQSALQRKEYAETLFNLEEVGDAIVDGVHVDKPNPSDDENPYMVHAFLTTLDAQGTPRHKPPTELRSTSFSLDGKAICFKDSNANCYWNKGTPLKRYELVCRGSDCTLSQDFVHRFAVTIGKQDSGDPQNPPKVYVNFSLRQPPYNHFDVIRPLEVTIYVAEHRFDPLTLLPFLLLLLGLLAALMLLRPRFALPKDLGYGLATMANPHRFQARRLPSASPWKLMFSRKAERVITDRDGELLGWIRPEDDELYGLRPAPGVEVVDPQGKVLEPERGGVTLMQVHQAYRLRRSDGDLMVRMEYL